MPSARERGVMGNKVAKLQRELLVARDRLEKVQMAAKDVVLARVGGTVHDGIVFDKMEEHVEDCHQTIDKLTEAVGLAMKTEQWNVDDEPTDPTEPPTPKGSKAA